MLKSTVMSAVVQLKLALQDLLVDSTLVRRTYGEHVPGQAPTPTEQSTSVKVALTRFKSSEVDGDRVKATDYRGIVFPEDLIPEVNDLITVDSMSKTFRVINDDKVMVGDQVAVTVLQLRL